MIARGWHLVSAAAGHVADLIFPPTCACCALEIDEASTGNAAGVRLCENCLVKLLPIYSQRCLQCGAGISITTVPGSGQTGAVREVAAQTVAAQNGRGFPGTVEQLLPSCRNCARSSLRFDFCVSLGNYELQTREAVLRCKSGTDDALTMTMAKLLAQKVVDSCEFTKAKFDLVVPIPIHWRRRLGRQSVVSELIALQVAQRLNIRCRLRGLKYNRLTVKQGTLSTTDRVQNVHQAISVTKPALFRGQAVLLVDDVMTSGATMNEAAKACFHVGAQTVSAAILARGVGRSMNR